MTALPALKRRRLPLLCMLLAATALSACASDAPASVSSTDTPDVAAARRQASAELRSRPIPDDPVGRAAYYAQLAEAEPDNVEVAILFAKSLRGIGSVDRSIEFVEECLARHPNQPDLMAEYGKALVAGGRSQRAVMVLLTTRTMKPGDWSVLVALGVAYDQMNDYANARKSYEAALALSPNNPSILNNLGLSYLASGDRQTGARYIRMAAAAPGADARIRANLALVADVPAGVAEAAPAAAAAPAPAPAAEPASAGTDHAAATPADRRALDVDATPAKAPARPKKETETPPAAPKTAKAAPAYTNTADADALSLRGSGAAD